jgi:hypothetical protein
VQYHHAPQLAPDQSSVTAAVHVSDLLVRHRKIGDSGNYTEVPVDGWLESPGWRILVNDQSEAKQERLRTGLSQSLERLPAIVDSLV